MPSGNVTKIIPSSLWLGSSHILDNKAWTPSLANEHRYSSDVSFLEKNQKITKLWIKRVWKLTQVFPFKYLTNMSTKGY